MVGQIFKRLVCGLTLIAFVLSSVMPASAQTVLHMPAPGQMVAMSPRFEPAVLVGLQMDRKNPFQFDFLIHRGEKPLAGEERSAEYQKLIKYFLASLTVPNTDMWVNLSPYEHGRMIADNFSLTEMGRDLLAQDYLLKQITASLIYPENEAGKAFWSKVYQKAQEVYGTTDIPIDTFNKVWITADKAVIYEKDNTALLVEHHLKVMLESDYIAQSSSLGSGLSSQGPEELAKNVLREVVIPLLEKEVNEGEHFALLRQVYSAMIMATWFKRSLRQSLVGQMYVDRSKVAGIDQNDPQANEKIYEQYLEAYKKGVFNFIREERDVLSEEMIPRKYFSGGIQAMAEDAAEIVSDVGQLSVLQRQALSDAAQGADRVRVALADAAMSVSLLGRLKDKLMLGRLFGKTAANVKPEALPVADLTAGLELLQDKEVRSRKYATEIQTEEGRFVDLPHVLSAVNRLSTGKRGEDVTAFEELVGTEGLSKDRVDVLNGFDPQSGASQYEDPRLELAIDYQSGDREKRGILEATSNAIDALYALFPPEMRVMRGQFGKGVKQLLALVRANGRDRLEVLSRKKDAQDGYKLTVIRSTQGTYYLQLKIASAQEIRQAVPATANMDFQHGTIVRYVPSEKIARTDADRKNGQSYSVAGIAEAIRERSSFIWHFKLMVEEGAKSAKKVNGFDAVVFPQDDPLAPGSAQTEGLEAFVAVHEEGVTIVDPGIGMDARAISRMLSSGDKNPKQLNAAEVEREKRHIIVGHKAKTGSHHSVALARYGETIFRVTISEDVNPAALLGDEKGEFVLDSGALVTTQESREQFTISEPFKTGILSAVEKVLALSTKTPEEKVKYVNTIVLFLEGLLGDTSLSEEAGNKYNKKVVMEAVSRIGALLEPLVRQLRDQGKLLLPHQKGFEGLAIPAGKEAIFVHEFLFDWNPADLEGIGAVRAGNFSALGGLPVFGLPLKSADNSRHIPLIRTARAVFVPQDEIKALNDLLARKSSWTSQDGQVFLSLAEMLKIDIDQELKTAYEVGDEITTNKGARIVEAVATRPQEDKFQELPSSDVDKKAVEAFGKTPSVFNSGARTQTVVQSPKDRPVYSKTRPADAPDIGLRTNLNGMPGRRRPVKMGDTVYEVTITSKEFRLRQAPAYNSTQQLVQRRGDFILTKDNDGTFSGYQLPSSGEGVVISSQIRKAAISSSGRYFVFQSNGAVMIARKTAMGAIPATLQPAEKIEDWRLSEDGDYLFAKMTDGTYSLYDLDDPSKPEISGADHIELTSSGNEAFVLNKGGFSVRFLRYGGPHQPAHDATPRKFLVGRNEKGSFIAMVPEDFGQPGWQSRHRADEKIRLFSSRYGELVREEDVLSSDLVDKKIEGLPEFWETYDLNGKGIYANGRFNSGEMLMGPTAYREYKDNPAVGTPGKILRLEGGLRLWSDDQGKVFLDNHEGETSVQSRPAIGAQLRTLEGRKVMYFEAPDGSIAPGENTIFSEAGDGYSLDVKDGYVTADHQFILAQDVDDIGWWYLIDSKGAHKTIVLPVGFEPVGVAGTYFVLVDKKTGEEIQYFDPIPAMTDQTKEQEGDAQKNEGDGFLNAPTAEIPDPGDVAYVGGEFSVSFAYKTGDQEQFAHGVEISGDGRQVVHNFQNDQGGNSLYEYEVLASRNGVMLAKTLMGLKTIVAFQDGRLESIGPNWPSEDIQLSSSGRYSIFKPESEEDVLYLFENEYPNDRNGTSINMVDVTEYKLLPQADLLVVKMKDGTYGLRDLRDPDNRIVAGAEHIEVDQSGRIVIAKMNGTLRVYGFTDQWKPIDSGSNILVVQHDDGSVEALWTYEGDSGETRWQGYRLNGGTAEYKQYGSYEELVDARNRGEFPKGGEYYRMDSKSLWWPGIIQGTALLRDGDLFYENDYSDNSPTASLGQDSRMEGGLGLVRVKEWFDGDKVVDASDGKTCKVTDANSRESNGVAFGSTRLGTLVGGSVLFGEDREGIISKESNILFPGMLGLTVRRGYVTGDRKFLLYEKMEGGLFVMRQDGRGQAVPAPEGFELFQASGNGFVFVNPQTLEKRYLDPARLFSEQSSAPQAQPAPERQAGNSFSLAKVADQFVYIEADAGRSWQQRVRRADGSGQIFSYMMKMNYENSTIGFSSEDGGKSFEYRVKESRGGYRLVQNGDGQWKTFTIGQGGILRIIEDPLGMALGASLSASGKYTVFDMPGGRHILVIDNEEVGDTGLRVPTQDVQQYRLLPESDLMVLQMKDGTYALRDLRDPQSLVVENAEHIEVAEGGRTVIAKKNGKLEVYAFVDGWERVLSGTEIIVARMEDREGTTLIVSVAKDGGVKWFSFFDEQVLKNGPVFSSTYKSILEERQKGEFPKGGEHYSLDAKSIWWPGYLTKTETFDERQYELNAPMDANRDELRLKGSMVFHGKNRDYYFHRNMQGQRTDGIDFVSDKVASLQGDQVFFGEPVDGRIPTRGDIITGRWKYKTKQAYVSGDRKYVLAEMPLGGLILIRYDGKQRDAIHAPEGYELKRVMGNNFIFVNPVTLDRMVLDAEELWNASQTPAAQTQTKTVAAPEVSAVDPELLKRTEALRQAWNAKRKSWVVQVQAAYTPLFDKVPGEYRSAVVRAAMGSIERLFVDQKKEIEERLKTQLEAGQDGEPDWTGLSFDRFERVMNEVLAALEDYWPVLLKDLARENALEYEAAVVNFFSGIVRACADKEIDVKNWQESRLLELVALGWDLTLPGAVTQAPALLKFLDALKAVDPYQTFQTRLKLVSFLAKFIARSPVENLETVTRQIAFVLDGTLTPKARARYLKSISEVFENVDMEELLVFAEDPMTVPPQLRQLASYAALLINKGAKDVPEEKRAKRAGRNMLERLPSGVRLRIPQLLALQKMLLKMEGEQAIIRPEDIEAALVEGRVPGMTDQDWRDFLKILNDAENQTDPGGHLREIPANAQDEGANLRVSFRLDPVTGEYREIYADDGPGAKEPLALMLPGYSTKAAGEQKTTIGFFGYGKMTILRGADKVRFTTVSRGVVYEFELTIDRDPGTGIITDYYLSSMRQLEKADDLQGTTVERVFSAGSVIPQVERGLTETGLKTFAGMAQVKANLEKGEKGFAIFLEGEGGAQAIPVKKILQAEVPMEGGNLRIWRTDKDMPPQIISRKGYQVQPVSTEYLKYIPRQLLGKIKELGLVIEVPLDLTRSRNDFVGDREARVEMISRTLAIAFYQFMARGLLTEASFNFRGYSRDWETRRGREYWDSVANDDLAKQVSEMINNGRLAEINSDSFDKLLKTELSYTNLILLLAVPVDWSRPDERASAWGVRMKVLEESGLLTREEGEKLNRQAGQRREYATSSVINLEEKKRAAAGIQKSQEEIRTPEKFVIPEEELTDAQQDFRFIARNMARSFGVEEVVLMRGGSFAGAFKSFRGKRTMFLADSLVFGWKKGAAGGFIHESTNTVIHELAHLLEHLSYMGDAFWGDGFTTEVHTMGQYQRTHQGEGAFADFMKEVAFTVQQAVRQYGLGIYDRTSGVEVAVGTYKPVPSSRDRAQGVDAAQDISQADEARVEAPAAVAAMDGAQYGGIDLNDKYLTLDIRRDGAGEPLPVVEQAADLQNIQGFVPVIVDITPLDPSSLSIFARS